MPNFIEYEESDLFPFGREQLWRMLQAHLDDQQVSSIHPLILSQKVVTRDGESTTVERTIDARGRRLTSQWKLTYRPPDYSRWEVVGGEGPYAAGSSIENHYLPASGGTLIQSRMRLRVTVVPFFIPQRGLIRRVLNDIDREDRAYLSQHP